MKPRSPENALARIDSIVQITPNLDTEFRAQSANYSWLSSYYVESKDRVRRLKNELEMLRADLMDKARKHFSGSKVNKDVLEGWVLRRKVYQDQLSLLFDAQLTEDRLTAGIKALEFKRESLMSLGANLRREITENIREPVVRAAVKR